MSRAPKKRDPKLNPLQGNEWVAPRTPTPAATPKAAPKAEEVSSRFTTCKRCMGFGGMGGGCPSCGGTGFTD